MKIKMLIYRSTEPYLGIHKLYSWTKGISLQLDYLTMISTQALFNAATYSVFDLIKTLYIRTIKADSEGTFGFHPPLERFTLVLLYFTIVRGISGQIQITSFGKNNNTEDLEHAIHLIQEIN